MRHSLRAVSLSWLIVLVPILAGSPAGADGNGRVPSNDASTRNKAPIARKDAATTARDTTVTINVTANDRDRDGRIARRTVRIVGASRHGRARKQRNGTVIYTPDTGFSGQDTFRYRVKDNRGALSNRARVRVTVLPGARTPVANDDTAATAVDTPVVINVVANDTDADGNLDPRSVAIATNPRSGALVNRFDGTVTYTPSAGFFGTDAFAYTVRDSQGATSNVARVTVAVNAGPVPVNTGPVAAAGPDQNAVTGQPLTLNGSASSDPDGDTLAFSWRFLSIPPTSARADADIVNPASPAPSFTPDVEGNYELELTVTDGTLSDTDGVVITAAAPGRVPPNAAAGPDQSAEVLTLVTLNGSASNDPDNGPNPLTFQWAFAQVPLGSALINANITNATSAQASFTPDVTGLYRLTLTVSDGALSDSDDIDINVTPVNVPPNANAGSDIVVQLGPPAQTATLNGGASDDPDDFPNPTLTFQWTFVSKPTASTLTNGAIAGATTATASFTPDVAGVYVLRLEVSDGMDTAFDQVMVTANAAPVANVPPVANPDSTTTPFNSPVLINVVQNDTDSDGTIVPASVAIVGNPTNGTAVPNGSGAVTYTPTTGFFGTGSFGYTVDDNQGAASNPATVTINVDAPIVVEPPCGNGVINPPEQCDDGNTTSGDGCSSTCTVEAPQTPPFSQIQAIFNDNSRGNACTNSGCHNSGTGNFAPDLTSGNSFASLVNVASTNCAGFVRVVPNQPANSCLFLRVDGATAGSKMPRLCTGAPPAGNCLSQAQIDTIEAWINGGATNP